MNSRLDYEARQYANERMQQQQVGGYGVPTATYLDPNMDVLIFAASEASLRTSLDHWYSPPDDPRLPVRPLLSAPGATNLCGSFVNLTF